ncbi:hypothetical protein [Serratia sp. UGAL515B_01]|uniref:hypothetical protein n=1 Tax=Serratia sp. UGAL515B_01 TaxID=2986763 RepID=UPI0029554EB4|nr:hypothetical protein [Serratia sp. UGAL515B_01]WON77666.1 hypothetical protein OK023_02895 [Serratia sp. UGAL515B_01]
MKFIPASLTRRRNAYATKGKCRKKASTADKNASGLPHWLVKSTITQKHFSEKQNEATLINQIGFKVAINNAAALKMRECLCTVSTARIICVI